MANRRGPKAMDKGQTEAHPNPTIAPARRATSKGTNRMEMGRIVQEMGEERARERETKVQEAPTEMESQAISKGNKGRQKGNAPI